MFILINLVINSFLSNKFYKFRFFVVTSLKPYSTLSPKTEVTQREGHSEALSGEKTDPGTKNLGSPVVSSSAALVIVGLLTSKSDAPCRGEGLRGYAGRVSQCVSAAEPAPPHLSNDLEGKWKSLLCRYSLKSRNRL